MCLAAVLLTGCGASVSTDETKVPPTSTPATPEPSSSATAGTPDGDGSTAPAPDGDYTAELQVTVTSEPGGDGQEYVLQCDGDEPSPASNVPSPAEACALVQDSAEALFFTESDPTLQCTQQYGGPQTATVTGTVDGQPVDTSFSRTDGCEISRWDAMEPILGAGGVQ